MGGGRGGCTDIELKCFHETFKIDFKIHTFMFFLTKEGRLIAAWALFFYEWSVFLLWGKGGGWVV